MLPCNHLNTLRLNHFQILKPLMASAAPIITTFHGGSGRVRLHRCSASTQELLTVRPQVALFALCLGYIWAIFRFDPKSGELLCTGSCAARMHVEPLRYSPFVCWIRRSASLRSERKKRVPWSPLSHSRLRRRRMTLKLRPLTRST